MKQVKDKKEKVEQPLSQRTVSSTLKFLRIAPRKARVVINAVRYQPPHKAFAILCTLKNKAARFTEKILKTAAANAKTLGLDENRLYISEVRADGGPTMKRFIERSMGRGNRILKRTTHLTLKLSEGQKKWNVPGIAAAKEAQQPAPKAEKTTGKKKKAASAAK